MVNSDEESSRIEIVIECVQSSAQVTRMGTIGPNVEARTCSEILLLKQRFDLLKRLLGNFLENSAISVGALWDLKRS